MYDKTFKMTLYFQLQIVPEVQKYTKINISHWRQNVMHHNVTDKKRVNNVFALEAISHSQL